ncbi:MAG: rhomboid family intramembrane serine protease [Ignavibacteriales bacterium]|nr:rhomboid family intramembrane serine protease [Ignavibacteriales bacterium]
MSYYRYSSSSYSRPSFFGGFKFFPPVIKALLISNVAVYFLASFFSLFRIQGMPLSVFIDTILPLYPIGSGFYVWQLFTYMFMHGGLMHLLFNMLALWMFGMELENLWGSKKFFLYYMLCGLGAGLSNLFIAPLFAAGGPTVGASGAVYGVLIAFGMLFPERPIFIYFLLPIRAKYFVLLYIGIEIYAGVTGTMDGIAHFAHLGGAAVGFLYLIAERKGFSFDRFIPRRKMTYVSGGKEYEYASSGRADIADASYFDLRDERKSDAEKSVDDILDKINQHSYQSLTEEERRILFEASKKLN